MTHRQMVMLALSYRTFAALPFTKCRQRTSTARGGKRAMFACLLYINSKCFYIFSFLANVVSLFKKQHVQQHATVFNNNVDINQTSRFPLLPTLFHIWHAKILIPMWPALMSWSCCWVILYEITPITEPCLALKTSFGVIVICASTHALPSEALTAMTDSFPGGKIIGTYLHAYRQYTHIYAHTVHHYLALKLTSCLTLMLPSLHRQ